MLQEKIATKICLNEAIDMFLISLEGAKDAKTVHWYRHKLERLVKWFDRQIEAMPLSEVTIRQLEHFRASLVGNMSDVTLGGYVRALRRFFSWCVGEELLKVSPATRLELPAKEKRPRAGVLDEDVEAMISTAETLRERAILCFLRDTWTRAGGLCGLNITDVNLANCSAVVTEKFGKSRAVNFSSEAASLLEELIGDRKRGPVFLNLKGKRMTIFTLYDLVKSCALRAGLDVESKGDDKVNWSPHQWRHGGIRSFLQSGAGTLGEASQLAGHSDIKVTHDYYGTFEVSELKAVHRRWLKKRDKKREKKRHN